MIKLNKVHYFKGSNRIRKVTEFDIETYVRSYLNVFCNHMVHNNYVFQSDMRYNPILSDKLIII